MAKSSGTTTAASPERLGVMRIYSHPACPAHDTGPGHPERPQRLSAVTDALHAALPQLEWQEAPRASRGQL